MFDVNTKVLVVDDKITMRKIVSKILHEIGFTDITEAVDGEEAWEVIRQQGNFGLVVSDWNMPNTTGLDL